jgi:hypothetical protein
LSSGLSHIPEFFKSVVHPTFKSPSCRAAQPCTATSVRQPNQTNQTAGPTYRPLSERDVVQREPNNTPTTPGAPSALGVTPARSVFRLPTADLPATSNSPAGALVLTAPQFLTGKGLKPLRAAPGLCPRFGRPGMTLGHDILPPVGARPAPGGEGFHFIRVSRLGRRCASLSTVRGTGGEVPVENLPCMF